MVLGLVYYWLRWMNVVSKSLCWINFAQNEGQRQVKGSMIVQVLGPEGAMPCIESGKTKALPVNIFERCIIQLLIATTCSLCHCLARLSHHFADAPEYLVKRKIGLGKFDADKPAAPGSI